MESTIMVRDETEPLTELEQTDLAACEEVIGRGLQSFVEVGTALVRIRDERLYRQDYGTFESYCEWRWGMSRVHAFRQIEAARVCRMLPDGNTPANEAQVRPLTRIRTEDGELDNKAIARVWRRVVERAPEDRTGRKVIPARIVEEAVRPVLQRRGVRFPRLARPRGASASGLRESRAAEAETPAEAEPAGATEVKKNITDEQFAVLHDRVTELAAAMAKETLPQEVRTLIEEVCWIVLD